MPPTTVAPGTVGRTISPLRPSGKVDIGGVNHEARSAGEWVDAGRPVIVVRTDAFNLVVRLATPEEVAAADAAPQRLATPLVAPVRQRWSARSQLLLASAVWGTILGAWALTVAAWFSGSTGSGMDWLHRAGQAVAFGLAFVLYADCLCPIARQFAPNHSLKYYHLPWWLLAAAWFVTLPTVGATTGAAVGIGSSTWAAWLGAAGCGLVLPFLLFCGYNVVFLVWFRLFGD